MFPSKIVLQVTGSISCFKAAALASALIKRGCEVQVVATASALKFVGEATFEGLTSKAVQTQVFASGQMMDHIHLARWADAFILYPASANTLNRLALGLAEDLIGTLALAKDAGVPYFIAPAMNQQMWQHPSVQASVQTLKSWGHHLVEPASGLQACGESGPGRLVEPEDMMQILDSFFKTKATGSVLITSGGTKEPLDRVRYIGNTSTGRTGAHLAESFAKAGYDVTYLCSEEALRPLSQVRLETFKDFESLNLKLETLLGQRHFDVVVHAAAVSDYSVEKIEGAELGDGGKIDSQGDLKIHLKRNFKILSRLRSYSKNPDLKVVGFKLTVGDDPDDILNRLKKMREESQPDIVVHNDLSGVSDSFHRGQIFIGVDQVVSFNSKNEMADALLNNLNPEVKI